MKDVQNVGKKFDVKDVSDGYALNFLVPNNLAITATPQNIKRVDIEKKTADTEKKIHKDLLIKNIDDVDGQTIVLEEKANEKGHLFAQIHKKEIIEALQRELRIQLNEENIIIEEPIKQIGEFTIPVESQDKKAKFILQINKKD